jgi:hypothetical protein
MSERPSSTEKPVEPYLERRSRGDVSAQVASAAQYPDLDPELA